MAFIGLTREKNMYYGAKKELILQARVLRKEMTRAEEILWSFLRNQKLNGAIFRRQHPIDIFIVDFYCHKHKLVIEVDGSIHDLDVIAEKDENRTYELEQIGLRFIRFSNEEVLNETENVIKTIKVHLLSGLAPPTSGESLSRFAGGWGGALKRNCKISYLNDIDLHFAFTV
jgi:very-short-patch-repair endonuclease